MHEFAAIASAIDNHLALVYDAARVGTHFTCKDEPEALLIQVQHLGKHECQVGTV